jgi:hypothetical protein
VAMKSYKSAAMLCKKVKSKNSKTLFQAHFFEAVEGLAALTMGNFLHAVICFKNCCFESLQEHPLPMLSSCDIGLYLGLCALASYNREDLFKLFNDPNCREFIELVSPVKALLDNFYRAFYSSCVVVLRELQLIYILLKLHRNCFYA